jgi:selenocysteine-specific elongation factor
MGVAVPAGEGWLVDPRLRERLRERLVAEVRGWATAHPLESGLPVEVARQRLGLPDAALVELLRRDAGLDAAEGRLRESRSSTLPERVARAVEAVLADLAVAPFAAPEAGRLAELGLGARELSAAVRAGVLLRVADGVVLAPGATARAAQVLAGLAQPFTLSEARQALGTSRRVAVPLLELLDRERVTERLPDDRRRVTASRCA